MTLVAWLWIVLSVIAAMIFAALIWFGGPAVFIGDSQPLDGVVALGVVIRGETPHFEYVAGECARGIMNVQLATGVPIGFGVLTTDTRAQADERADPRRGDKGYDAALAAATVATIDPAKRETSRAGFR